jgi:2'-5' RNA ligase
MSETMRLFVAVELPPQVSSVLADLVAELKAARIQGLRPVRSEGIHLTLKFLGDAPKERVESIVDAVSRVAQAHKPFKLELGKAGVFPSRSSPRVLWVGVEGEMEQLRALQQQMDEALAAIGFAREGRAFSPHLTVGRIREGTPPADRQRIAEALFSFQIQPELRIEVDSLSLMRSTLHPQGAIYERLAAMPLQVGLIHGGTYGR